MLIAAQFQIFQPCDKSHDELLWDAVMFVTK